MLEWEAQKPYPDPRNKPLTSAELWLQQWLPPEASALFIASPRLPAGRGKSISVFADSQL